MDRVSRKGSVFGLSCDFVVYSWIWFVSCAYYAGAYLMSTFVVFQYANRYPEHPSFYTSKLTFVLDCVGSLVTSALIYQTFHKYKKSRQGNEALSVLFYYVLFLMTSGLVWLLWNYLRGKATLNELDLANYFWLLSYASFSFRLISQCSTNWFFCRFYNVHKHFLPIQIVSLFFMTNSLAIYKWHNTNWYELPTNLVSSESLLLNWICLGILLYQQHIYKGGKPIIPR
ncbi:hypothetical protein FT663_01025 [Candidozyma haemuli var. vulneris]|nr:hypothetical protein FT662_02341 [[Candida] haemuloni var. vulneris]KAF3994795.1 hypothetical protein FT663_01025 [[Candida] haemuloni var. vulneris]